LDRDATHAALRAGRYGALAYPGPVGELINRELRGYVDTGHQLDVPALAPRLIAFLAAQAGEADLPTNPYAHLPARYRPGSPLHWDYGTEQ
jgi:hypothetical protein